MQFCFKKLVLEMIRGIVIGKSVCWLEYFHIGLHRNIGCVYGNLIVTIDTCSKALDVNQSIE